MSDSSSSVYLFMYLCNNFIGHALEVPLSDILLAGGLSDL